MNLLHSYLFASIFASIAQADAESTNPSLTGRSDTKSLQRYNERTSAYYVDSTSIPEVPFDVGESYSGQMSIGSDLSLFFWFFPTDNPAGKEDTVIWFNGGPGCSSLEGLIQENGPFNWRPGTSKPIANPWSWHKLANVVWVEYPVGTGFSRGSITAQNNRDLAEQFLSFWANFTDTFNIRNNRIFIAGESYAGVHVPYVGSALLAMHDSEYYDVQGALIYDPVLPYVTQLGLERTTIPAFARYWRSLLGFSTEGNQRIVTMSQQCRLDEYFEQHLTYPPPRRPWAPCDDRCPVFEEFMQNAITANNCYNIYNILDYCPQLSNAIGFPGDKVPNGTITWPNRLDVQQALHIKPDPASTWQICQPSPVFSGSKDGNYNDTEHDERLRSLVEGTQNVIIGSGLADTAIFPNSTALAIQHLAWNGAQGFQSATSREKFGVPISPRNALGPPGWSGGGEMGSAQTERGLTYSTIYRAGHQVPQYAPSAAFRHLEILLGRVKTWGGDEPWSVNISTSFVWPY